ncbi:bifunctional diguanylate cyclase/phosphodiesterase [bacterium]|nr:bifunctional diguanylate cyclase/phosphodiesterase [bacterium]MBU1990315.1 bifunctional diguanylate cyclase/phosphodiesterase [bacterium]
MKFSKLIFFVLSMGILSSLALVYFYTMQRDFTRNHREFLLCINELKNKQASLSYSILQDSLFTYSNQDRISHEREALLQSYKTLSNSLLLKEDTYAPVLKDLRTLKVLIDENIENIEEYLMLNAAVKNSLIFLTRHVEIATLFEKEDLMLYIQANKILKQFNNTLSMQDLDYISGKDLLLRSDSANDDVQNFIKNFNMHSSYLLQKYPHFLHTTKLILENTINNSINKTGDYFSELALNDFKALDLFAVVLFALFIISTLLIIILLLKYFKENKKLTETTKSLEYSISHDHLTDLSNRKAFVDDIKMLQNPHLLIINIDGFKNINDIYGNSIGNSLLRALAEFLKAKMLHITKSKVYRIGGDEFGILFDTIDEEKALEIARKLEKEIALHDFIIQNLEIHIIVSISSNNIAPILENADLALKLIKKDLTNRVIQYKDELNLKKSVKQNLKTIQIVKNALNEDRVVPYFQPIVNLQTLKIEKYEALVRIKLPGGTVLSPYLFLDTSKQTSYYYDLTKIMIEKTIQTAKKFPNYRFSINISMIDILNQEITQALFEQFNKNFSIASRIDIEILESEHIKEISEVQEFIKKLHSYGSKVLIDDFGSGYSNFSYFADLDIDIIKIDGSIIQEITTNERKHHMLKSIYKFSKGMGLLNIAEFVETREMAILLKEIGVEYAQGYYFGHPQEEPLKDDTVSL